MVMDSCIILDQHFLKNVNSFNVHAVIDNVQLQMERSKLHHSFESFHKHINGD